MSLDPVRAAPAHSVAARPVAEGDDPATFTSEGVAEDPVPVENHRLVSEFGATPISELGDLPDSYVFRRGLVYSHRDFVEFQRALRSGKRCAIVSGFNPSGSLHLGHRALLDLLVYYQRTFDMRVFVPVSADESYVTGRVPTLAAATENSISMVREILAYGLDPRRTTFLIDTMYTNIYNLAIELSRWVTLSTVRATYGNSVEENLGRSFYPSVQAAHILLPSVVLGYDHVLVPIGPDEDAHLRLCRDVACRSGVRKPSVLHFKLQPGTDGAKMSKSRGNTIGLFDSEEEVRRRVHRAFSGGAASAADHRRRGGDPARDVALHYLEKFYLPPAEGAQLADRYRRGEVLSGEIKQTLAQLLCDECGMHRSALRAIADSDLIGALLENSQAPYPPPGHVGHGPDPACSHGEFRDPGRGGPDRGVREMPPNRFADDH